MSNNLKAPLDHARVAYWTIFGLLVVVFLLMLSVKQATQKVPVLARDVPAYHVLTSQDLATKRISVSQVPVGVVSNTNNLIKHYTRESLRSGEPILTTQLGSAPDERLISNALKVEIPLEQVVSISGNLQAGDVISLAAAPSQDAAPVPVLSEVLVLDVNFSSTNPLIKLAIPLSQWPEFLAKTYKTKLVLARQIR